MLLIYYVYYLNYWSRGSSASVCWWYSSTVLLSACISPAWTSSAPPTDARSYRLVLHNLLTLLTYYIGFTSIQRSPLSLLQSSLLFCPACRERTKSILLVFHLKYSNVSNHRVCLLVLMKTMKIDWYVDLRSCSLSTFWQPVLLTSVLEDRLYHWQHGRVYCGTCYKQAH